jgi:hypothetical protein
MPSNLRTFTVLVALFVGAVFGVTMGVIVDTPSATPPAASSAPSSTAPAASQPTPAALTADPLADLSDPSASPLNAPAATAPATPTAAPTELRVNNPSKVAALTVAHTPPSGEATSSVRLVDSAFADSIRDREPHHVADAFDADVGQVWAWVRVSNSDASATHVTLVWRHGDRERARVELPVGARAKTWRTWSSKRIMPHQTGPWSVDVLDAQGHLLDTLHFHINTPTDAPATARVDG